MKINVKNMVCDRCKTVLQNEFANTSISIKKIALGEIVFSEGAESQIDTIREILTRNGFEMIEDLESLLVANVKMNLQSAIQQYGGLEDSLSNFLATKLNKDYSIISKSFSRNQDMTIEKYLIKLKIEKVKEHIQMRRITFSEIAYELHYKSSGHLATQFKSITGMSMTDYKNLEKWNRRPLDQIV